MDKNKCSSCGGTKCSCKNKDFTKRVIEIDNPEQITLMRKVVVPASMGDDTTVPPTVGKYKNVLLYYEANHKSYLYSSDGIPTQLVNGVTDYEQAVNLPQINGVTLLGDKSSADLKLADAPVVVHVTNNNMWSSDKTSQEIYELFNSGVNVVVEFDERPSDEKTWPVLQLGYDENNGALIGIIAIGYTELEETTWNSSFVKIDLRANKTVASTEIRLQEKLTAGDGIEIEDNTISISDIEQYAHFFDTVADMKAATNLVAGDYVRTGGFYAVNDGGGALYKITDTGTANEMDVIAVGNLYAVLCKTSVLNVKQFGAYGDSTHGDSATVQYVFNQSNSASTVYFPKGIYICGNIQMPYPVDVIGEESTLTETMSTPILDINIQGEYRNHFIKNLRFINNGTGNCVETNTTSSFITSRFENCFFHAANGWGLKTNLFFSHSLIELCTFSKNGLYLECGDANTVRKCMFYGIGTGIFLKPVDFGMLNNTIENNTIVNQGYAIHVERGDQVVIANNQIEYGGSYTNSNNPNCSVFINGQFQTCKNVIVDENNFGGGSHLSYNIVIYSGKHCKITRNRFHSTAQEDIKVFNYYGGSNYNSIKDNIVYNNAGYRPRTDKWQPVRVSPDQWPNSVSNVWLPLALNNSEDIMYYMRDDNNVIHFQPTHANFTTSTGTIATLPTGYWPKNTTVINGSKDGSQFLFTIRYNGEIIPNTAILGATDFIIDDFLAEMGVSNID